MRTRPDPPQTAETLPQADVALRIRRRGASPKLPHERDESPSLKVPPDPAIAQGHRDMEVNDNPNIDAGNEDAVLGHALYREIIGVIVRRVHERRRPSAS